MTRITEYPVENSEEEAEDEKEEIIYKPVEIIVSEEEKVIKPRKPQFGLDILTLVMSIGIVVYIPYVKFLNNWSAACGSRAKK